MEFELSPIQEQFWLQYQIDPKNSAYNMAFLNEITGYFDTEKANNAIIRLIEKHQILRSRFPINDNSPKQLDHTALCITIQNKDYSEKAIYKDITTPFDLESGPLFRIILYKKKKGSLLLFAFHHLLIDLRSKDILERDFSFFYNNPEYNNTPSHRFDYSNYTEWLRNFKTTENVLKCSPFGKESLKVILP